ncbi:MAG: metallophosphoesterase [Thiotrichales bacterium]|nr:metallophosphoesterase [Thiotrichales bacterium]
MKCFSILHISDLHRSPRDPISNDELVSALVQDRDRYVSEEPPIAAPEAVIVSGDVIQGVPLGTQDFATRIEEQYAVAEEFLDELVRRLVNGDRSRLIMVPGNHDVDWNTAYSALEAVTNDSIPGDLSAELHAEDSLLRWNWKTRSLYRIVDPELYERRLEAFWRFFDRFYEGVAEPMVTQNPRDVRLFSLCDDRIGVAAYNSCHGNDCFAYHGMIRQGGIARSDLDLNDSGKIHDLRMAVWHHGIEGSPYRTDYMDRDVVRGMIGRGFRLGLHGHQHKAQATAQEIRLPDRIRMAVIGAGSLCAGADDLPVGTHRQYNILEIAEDFCSVRTHVRAMSVANLFSGSPLAEFGGATYFDVSWEPPLNAVGRVVGMEAKRRGALVEEAEGAVKAGDAARAVAVLKSLGALEPGSYERQLCLSAAVDAQDWLSIVETTDPPTSIEELVQRFDAYYRLSDRSGAIDALNQFSQGLRLPEAVESELRARANVQEVIGR